jgi:uncharacterized protein (TIGR02284 family)
MNKNEHILTILEKLLEVSKISRKGYIDAAEQVKDPSLQLYFTQFAQQRAQFVEEFTSLIVRFGGSPADAKSFGGTMMRAWMDFKSGLIGDDTNGILDQCLKEEQTTLIEFENSLKEELPEDIKAVILEKDLEVKNTYDKLRDLKTEFLKTP